MWIEFLVLGVTAIALWFIYSKISGRQRAAYWTSKGVPFLQKGVTWLDLILGKKSLFDQDFYEQLNKLGEKVGGIFDQGKQTLFVADPDLIRAIFVKDADHFIDRRDFPAKDPVVAKMLVSLEGQEWKDVRSFLTPTFTSGKLRRMFEQFNSSGRKLKQHVTSLPFDDKLSGHIININETARRFTVDVIGSTVFGIETHSLSEENPIFYRLANKAANPSKFQIAKVLLFVFAPKLANFLKILPFDPEVVNYFRAILATALEQREKSDEKWDDFLQLMVEARKEDGHSKMRLSDDLIMAQCFLFFFAGFDTVANLLSLSAYVLAAFPSIQEKLRDSVERAIAANGGEISYESVSQMEYLDMFIPEVQRMYQSTPRLERKCTREYPLPGTSFTVPPGMIVMIDPAAMHFDPTYYPNPEEFDVERFSPENKAKRNPYVSLNFGLGPRNCIGMRFALIEAKVALAHLVLNFDVLPTPSAPIPIKMKKIFGTFRVPPDLKLCLKPRKLQ